MGRSQLYAGEIGRMVAAENVVNAYRSRDNFRVDGEPNWVRWAEMNPTLNSILIRATKAAYGTE